MLHTKNQIIKHKVGLLNLAEELQNVSRACKVMGISRDTFYRYDDATELAVIISQFNIQLMVSIVPVTNCARRVYLFRGVVFALFGSAMIWRTLRSV